MQFSQIETWLSISLGHFSVGGLVSQANFLLTAHLLVLKGNLLIIGIQYIFICWLLCVYNSAPTIKELFYSIPQETENNHCSFGSGNALSKAQISCENHMLLFISSLPRFFKPSPVLSQKGTPFFSTVDMLDKFQSEKYVSLH